MAKRIDYTGKVFGKLTILGDAPDHQLPSGYKQRHVKCICDCGTITTPRLMDVKRGRTRSCGCSTFVNTVTPQELSEQGKRLYKEGKFNHLRPRPQDEYSDFRYLLKCTKRKTSSRGSKSKENTLTLEDIKQVWEHQEGKCIYTGIKLVIPTHTDTKQDVPPYMKASVDRIDSEKGYIAGNIQIVSQTCNYAKNNMTHEEMCEFIRLIKVSELSS